MVGVVVGYDHAGAAAESLVPSFPTAGGCTTEGRTSARKPAKDSLIVQRVGEAKPRTPLFSRTALGGGGRPSRIAWRLSGWETRDFARNRRRRIDIKVTQAVVALDVRCVHVQRSPG